MSEAATIAEAEAAVRADPVPLAHHFDDPAQQHDSAVLGMWAFLGTEVMFFGGMIGAYAVYRTMAPLEFSAGSRHLKLAIGGVNTLVLLGSSLCVALAVQSAQLRRRSQTVLYLLATIVLGLGFIGIKGYEWSLEIHEHLLPGRHFRLDGWARSWTSAGSRCSSSSTSS